MSPRPVDTPSFPPSKRRRVTSSSSSSSSQLSPFQSPEPQSSVAVKYQPADSRPSGGLYEHTPPPSPVPDDDVASPAPKIDTDGINDDVVVAVIQHLEKTGNRPHLIKELAAILVTFNDTVAKYVKLSFSIVVSLLLTPYI